jgi:hypothetical protein
VSEPKDTLEHMLVQEHEGTRTWTVWGSSPEELLHRVTLIFAEHVHDDDEVHIAYNAMQTGWQDRASENGSTHTQLFFEYSALIVTRRQHRQPDRQLTDALWAVVDRLDDH